MTLLGGSEYEHIFTALEPGKTTAINDYTGNKVRVTVK